MINIFVIDEHPLIIDGFLGFFNNRKHGVQIAGSANSMEGAIPEIKNKHIDVIVMDAPGPINKMDWFIQLVRKQNASIKILVFTKIMDIIQLSKIWDKGVDGLMLKSCGGDEMLDAISRIVKGKQFKDQSIYYL